MKQQEIITPTVVLEGKDGDVTLVANQIGYGVLLIMLASLPYPVRECTYAELLMGLRKALTKYRKDLEQKTRRRLPAGSNIV